VGSQAVLGIAGCGRTFVTARPWLPQEARKKAVQESRRASATVTKRVLVREEYRW